jgi:hypothetical protein
MIEQRVPALGVLRFRLERDRPFDEGTITVADPAQAHGALIAYRLARLRERCGKRQRLDAGIGQRMSLVASGN